MAARKLGAKAARDANATDEKESSSNSSEGQLPKSAIASSTSTPSLGAGNSDAEALLKADHRKVEKLFEQYKSAGDDKKAELAKQICSELIVHTTLEEELFYPACRAKDVDGDDLDEAQVEHDGAKVMIAELLSGSPEDDYYNAKMTVLAEYIKHHVGEEEKAGEGIFAKARKAGVDLNALGMRIEARKTDLTRDLDGLSSRAPKPRALHIDLTSKQSNQETHAMARYSNDRDRDDRGRFTSEDDDSRGHSSSRGGYSSRSSGGRDHDDDRGNGGRSSRGRDRDDQGRFMSDDDDNRGSSRGGYSSRSGNRDYYDDDRNYNDRSYSDRNYSGRSGGRERDDQGWFMSDDDNRGSSHRGYSSRGGNGDYDDDRGYGSSRSGGRDRDDKGRFMSQEDNRSSSRGGPSRRSSRDDDDDRGGRASRSGGRGQGHGGWFGDSEGHSEAAERGWEARNSSRGGSSSRRSSRDDDDDRSGRSSHGGQGHGGWYGDSRGHSEAARRGWQDR
jgi:hypothetical protein